MIKHEWPNLEIFKDHKILNKNFYYHHTNETKESMLSNLRIQEANLLCGEIGEIPRNNQLLNNKEIEIKSWDLSHNLDRKDKD